MTSFFYFVPFKQNEEWKKNDGGSHEKCQSFKENEIRTQWVSSWVY